MPAGHRVVLRIVSGLQTGECFTVERASQILIGQAEDADLRLTGDPRVRPYHVRLEIDPPRGHLLDLGAAGSTAVNGHPVKEAMLRDGDTILLGRTALLFQVSAAATDKKEPPTVGSPTVVPPITGLVAVDAVPGYQLGRELGRGAMGVVHEAVQKATGNRVAIKMIVPQQCDERGMQFFMREASALSQLNHPRIVRFQELGLAGGRFFLVMEFVPTIDLEQTLARQAFASRLRTYCAIGCQVLDALEHAHTHGLVHRDVKPSNILVSREGQKLRAKLADFGLAKNYLNAGFSMMTAEGESRGTLPFMPPEQLLDCRHSTPAVDLYATAATLYYLLTGAFPRQTNSSLPAVLGRLEEACVPLRERQPECPAALAALIHKALAFYPRDRFASAAEMRQALLPLAQRTGSNG